MIHARQIKIRSYHCDLYGHVNNARYLEFLEEARWSLLDDHDSTIHWRERDIGFVVLKVEISYRRPAREGDVLEIRSRMKHLGGKSGVVHQEVVSLGSGKCVAEADVTFVVFDLKRQRPAAMAGDVREVFAAYLPEAEE